jgi:Ferritin-like
MSETPPVKLIPRNVAAYRRGRMPTKSVDVSVVAGNPMSTRLESGVGNCFPGLECDLRNLERRFFPFIVVDISDNEIRIVGADPDRAKASGLSADVLRQYRRIATDVAAGRRWVVRRLIGRFGPLGQLELDIAELTTPSFGQVRQPPDAWTAVRMLTEGTEVMLDLQGPANASMQLAGTRARYLDDNGALADVFRPGELTQSLCSPWTHDFRDCGCYYWASNHPDIALPPLPPGVNPNDPNWNTEVIWERRDRTADVLPAPATAEGPDQSELDYREINGAWQSLNFVIARRESTGSLAGGPAHVDPLPSEAALEQSLIYAAGVELAVTQEYLTAAYSLRPGTGIVAGMLHDDVVAAHGELMRIAIGEMRHLRAVNDVLRALVGPTRYQPALRVASAVPGTEPGSTRPVLARPANFDAIDAFIDIEKPSVSVDSVYAHILATVERDGRHEQAQQIRTIMSEGGDHFQTFLFIREWLRRHQESDFLRATQAPPDADPDHRNLQQVYLGLLNTLHHGYSIGVPLGGKDIADARNVMLGPLHNAAEALSAGGFLVVFEPLSDDRFKPVDPP